MGIILWIIFGALVGWIASLIMGTDEEQGMLGNMVVGIVGAILGGAIVSLFVGVGISGFNLSSVVIAVFGSIIVLFGYRSFTSS